ncbi:long-chain fatty acid--CoA ligase [Pueribacillus theae]|uniref:Long-chain fatty acid--CoA ligase n=1 Tax=Pueribacillus theae TaxID=2171751 RepID=A0A2U1K501_9BACI|nr:long-chain fatty acid--CoA ligase [Pueribacillus theae]PWA12274.1 long-chain fatty acid--CoA ligase [Pueribacillus theae]
MLLTNLIHENISKYGEYPFLYYGDKEISNIEIEKIGKQFARLLRATGIKKGDRVLVCMPNRPEVIYAYQAILRSGAIVIPVMYLLHENEINFILENSGASAVITSLDTLPKVALATKTLPNKPKIICVDGSSQIEDVEVIDWQKAMNQDLEAYHVDFELEESDLAVILYTSGTTGKPKGVMLTHRNLSANLEASDELMSDEDRGTTLGVLPLAHVYGFGVMNGCFYRGNSIVIFSKFEVDEVFKAIEKHKVKSFAAVPAMIHAMVSSKNSEKYDLSSLEAVGSGSAALPITLRAAFKAKFQAEVRDAYGLSEASPGVATQRKDMPIKEGSVGVPLPGVEIKIVNEDGEELPAGEVGELIVKGANITPGYYRNEEETKKALRNGWLYTGDMAKVDEDGYLYIVDRKKDLIIRGGFNIYPRDLEELLSKHEAVSEVAVIGIPSDSMGEEVAACVVKREGVQVTESDLINYCQKHLAKYKTPKHILFFEQLPRNGVGKILKIKLKEMVADIGYSNLGKNAN